MKLLLFAECMGLWFSCCLPFDISGRMGEACSLITAPSSAVHCVSSVSWYVSSSILHGNR